MKPSLNRLFVLVLGLSLSSTFVIAQGQVNAEAEIKEGLSYIQARKFKEAVKAFDRAVEKDPENAFAHYGLALSLANSKEYREAIRPLLRSLQLNPHPHWGNVTEPMVLSLLAEVEHNANLKAKTYEITYDYDRFKDLTTVRVDVGQALLGLELIVGYSASGYLPTKPDHFFFVFDSYSRDWRFLEERNRELNLLVDGQPLQLWVMERVKDKINTSTYGLSVNERLFMTVPYEAFVRIAHAKLIEMQLASSEFRLSDKQTQVLRDLLTSF